MAKVTNRKSRPEAVCLGWREWVCLPDLGIDTIKAKVDTGARTSALHAFLVEPYRAKGKDMLRFAVHPLQKRTDIRIQCKAEVLDRRNVTDSGGHREKRFVIATRLIVSGISLDAELTLTDRDSMRFRMLLGRTALCNRFLVDPARSYLTGVPEGIR